MLRFLVILMLSAFAYADVQAQDCDASDAMFVNETTVVSPGPSLPDSAGTGISESACIDSLFQFTFFIRVPSVLNVAGLPAVTLEGAILDSVVGLPEGIEAQCSSEDCFYAADSIGCIFLEGTTTDAVGEYPLVIFATAQTTTISFQISFPGAFAPGEYILSVVESCSETTSSVDLTTSRPVVYPNPSRDAFFVENFVFDRVRIYNLSGTLILQDDHINPSAAISTVGLQSGMYILELSNRNESVRIQISKM